MHVVIVVADDLGLTDVPFTATGSEVVTPRLTELAASGLVLDQYYVQPLCTPTRAAFLTGRHPVQLGLQHGVIRDAVPDAVPANETLLPSLLRAAGYRTHHVGKWHLGFHQPQFTPERRGFDTSFGYYTGNAEYWNHTSPAWGCDNYTAIDLHSANASHWVAELGSVGTYSTELFGGEAVAIVQRHARQHGTAGGAPPLFLYLAFEAVHGASSCYRADGPPDCTRPDDDELQVPARYLSAQSHIARSRRRLYAGMVGALDEAVGNLTQALEETGLMARTLLLFTTDNGAPFKHLGGRAMSNWPLRGGKGELWEGGVRGAAFLAGGALPATAARQRTLALISAADWFPTLLSLARVTLPHATAAALYGTDVWNALATPNSTARYAARRELLLNSDPISGRAALRLERYKLVRNEPASGWGPDPRASAEAGRLAAAAAAAAMPSALASGPDRSWWRVLDGHRVGDAALADQLFDVESDPEERHDLASDEAHAATLCRLQQRLEEIDRTLVRPPRLLPPDPRARPMAIDGLTRCTPSPVGPILCEQPIG